MRRTFASALFLSSLLAGAASCYGQYPGDRPRYERSGRQERALFDRTRSDLNRAAGYPYASRSDLKRFDEARRDLYDFESRFDQGRYSKHELDEAIGKIQHVVDRNSLDPRARGALLEDLRLMRDFRAYREHGHHDRDDYYNGYRR